MKDNWISVEERLPEIDEYVLWCDKRGMIWIEELDKDGNSWEMPDMIEMFGDECVPTHWQPLPSPPNKTNKL